MLGEFRQFVMKGSAAEIGIGMVLGATFSNLIDSFVTDILLPPIGLVMAKMNFSNLYISLNGTHYRTLTDAQEAGAVTINYGLFITSFIRFLLILFAIFIVIRQLNRWKKPNQDPVAAMTKKECSYCGMGIPTKAVKCPYCISDVNKPAESATDKQVNRKKAMIRIK
ncbi:large conductance mechanosensitive channel protein MscL [Sediminibacillus massiliensis]|uniref:large conductance mechanosensitive channel protein MscL n=1 Tax=Sediminibacillus massiliensis TaxID=1926277 RepID=UPI001FE5A6D1|nr:large conductance mechanosensitive channel protein MscL [Sediminibacillus massiliensis]